MKARRFFFLVATAIGMFAPAGGTVEVTGGRPPEPKLETAFPISCWTYYWFWERLDDDYTIDNWIRLGINEPLTPVVDGKIDKPAFRRFLDKCHAAGLKVIVYDNRSGPNGVKDFIKTGDEARYRELCREVKADWGDHPAVKGFYVYDEPLAADAARTFRAARIHLDEFPGKTPYLNLLPWSPGNARNIGAKDLDEYLDRAYGESGLDDIGYDCYSQTCRDDSAYDTFFMNLRRWDENARRIGKRWNTTLLCVPHFYYRIDGIGDLRFQLSSAVAMGAGRIVWFYPDCHVGYNRNFRDAPIDPFGERTESFRWLGTVNREFQHQFGAEFAKLRHESAYFAGAKTYGGIPAFLGDRQLLSIALGGIRPMECVAHTMLVSFLTDGAGTRYVALVNVSKANSCDAKLTFANDVCPSVKEWNRWKEMKANMDRGLVVNGVETTGKTVSYFFAPGQLHLIRLDARDK